MTTNMHWEFECITKEKAEELLEHNHLNRPVKQKIERIKADLIHGHFEPTHQGIAIAENGELVDGQHRLIAIRETGIPAWIWVCYNAPNSTKIDRGVNRTERESLYMAGLIEKGGVAWNKLTFPLVSFIIERNFGNNILRRSITEDSKYKVYLKHQDIIDPIIGIVNSHVRVVGSRSRSSIVLYAMLCALNNGIDKEKIAKWHHILTTGDFYSDDQLENLAGRGVLLLKRSLDSGVARTNVSVEEKNVLLGKIETSLMRYSKNEDVKSIRGAIVFDEITIDEGDLY